MVFAFRPTVREIELFPGLCEGFASLHVEDVDRSHIGSYFKPETAGITKDSTTNRTWKSLESVPKAYTVFAFELFCELPDWVARISFQINLLQKGGVRTSGRRIF